jgi:SAM-dependent methyltransferase
MSLKSTVGHIINDFLELISPSLIEGYVINSGIDHGLHITYYGERLVELPFVFRNIKKPPASVLDIGCTESSTPIQLAMMGYDVTGIDIRKLKYMHDNFKFIEADFINYNFRKRFDIVLAISSIEHFGLASYGTAKIDPDADKKTIKKINSLLKSGGQFIFTAPFGIHTTIKNYERSYDSNDIKNLMEQFKIIDITFYKVCAHKAIKKITEDEAVRIKHEEYGEYAVVLINSIKK